MIRSLMLTLPLVLAACVEPAPMPDPVVMPDEQACGAEALQSMVGSSAKVLETMRFGTTTRIIRPGMAVTMDYIAERLNIYINDKEVIERVSCG